jgi:hypothetical protein
MYTQIPVNKEIQGSHVNKRNHDLTSKQYGIINAKASIVRFMQRLYVEETHISLAQYGQLNFVVNRTSSNLTLAWQTGQTVRWE